MTDHHNHDDSCDCELRVMTAHDPLLLLVVTRRPDNELDVMLEGSMPRVLMPGALRALADDMEAEHRGRVAANN